MFKSNMKEYDELSSCRSMNFRTDSPAQFAAPETVFHLGVIWVGLWHPKFTLPHRDLFVQQIVPDLLLCDGAILWQYHRFLL